MKMVMPKMGMTMEEGTIADWKKREGEFVEKGEIILEIMTNKVNIEVEAPASGYLKILREVDDVVPVGEIIAFIEGEAQEATGRAEIHRGEEEVPWKEQEPIPVEPEREVVKISAQEERIPASPRARKAADDHGVLLKNVRGTGPDGAVTEGDVLAYVGKQKSQEAFESGSFSVSPLAERIAREKGVDLSRVRGTGLDGKITKEDVLRHFEEKHIEGRERPALPEERKEWEEKPGIEREWEQEKPRIKKPSEIELEQAIERPEMKPEPVVQPLPSPQPVSRTAEPADVAEEPMAHGEEPIRHEVKGKTIPLAGIRKLTAERMSRSKREAPHLTLGMDVDMTEAGNLKSSLAVTYTDILVKAVALALRTHPQLNSTLMENKIVLRDTINIGVAVARGEDLLVPVIHRADTLSLKKISQVTADIIERTRKDQLTEQDVLDGTFTISNLGMYNIDFFTPIINPPEAAILGVGRISPRPVVMKNRIEIREVATLSLSFDHRIVNGVPAALFLKEVRNLLEHPYKLLMEEGP
ncbi:MAG: 2-oxo acid dehydrogenase subunit E2 [Theionarchaea archaeon]|nr:2-oxo acid dehydrogenase subunit E2 [Theionarchaea archaeon]MBU7034626.1 2-oxo acid dehydrogenase subunit E2 [Theionarchaea archaeon]MBU7040617.1 2-oxo acid dehydrogenase subunit E2 [Theionarchaea archaeon]